MVKEKFLLIAVFLCLTACPKKNPETPAPVDSVPPISEDGGDMPGDSRKADVAEPVLPQTGAAAPSLEGKAPGDSRKASVAEPAPPQAGGDIVAPVPVDSAASVEAKKPASPISSALANDRFELKELADKSGYEITWDEVVKSDAVKGRGGSPLFDFYFFTVVNLLDDKLKGEKSNSAFHREFVHLCKQSDCAKGLDITKIDSQAMGVILHRVSSLKRFSVGLYDESDFAKSLETILFLQGYLSLSEWGPRQYQIAIKNEKDYEQPEDLPHRQAVRQNIMANESITEILVNLPHQFGPGLQQEGFYQHYDANVFIELGRFIRERNLNLRIMGGCGTYCVNYLLPAAQTIIIEPYGYIYTEGSIRGLLVGAQSVISAQRDYQLQQLEEQWLPQLIKPPVPATDESAKPESLLVQHVTKVMLMGFGLDPDSASEKTTEQQKQMASRFIEDLALFGKVTWEAEEFREFVRLVGEYQNEKNKVLRDWSEKDIEGFVKGMDTENQRHFLEKLALFVQMNYIDVEKNKRWINYLTDLRWLEQYTVPYFQEVRESLHSQTSYTYVALLDLIPHLVQDIAYGKAFAVPKVYYPVPEKEKPSVAALSAGLLRLLGMNVIGENNRDMLVKGWGDRVLYLNEEVIQNCQFFESLNSSIGAVAVGLVPQAYHTKEIFEECTTLPQ